MESELRFYSNSSESNPHSEELSLVELEIMVADLIVYSPLQPVLLPSDPSDEEELEKDLFQLE